MINLAYLTSSSYSGSTLFTFLMNQHPDIFTIGELEGWNYEEGEDFRCSCGENLIECNFFSSIAKAYRRNGLLYNPRDFGTSFRLSENERFNRYLTEEIAYVSNSRLENFRDSIFWRSPPFSRKLRKVSRANEVFVRQALIYNKAKIFLDAMKSPFRLRHLKRTNIFNIKVIYLVRDLRGQILSNMKYKSITAEIATRLWIRNQANICRVLKEFPLHYICFYENVCIDTQKTLNEVYQYLELDPHVFSGSFRQSDHHILGNNMRLKNNIEVKLNLRWREELSARDLQIITRVALNYAGQFPDSPETKLILHYLDV